MSYRDIGIVGIAFVSRLPETVVLSATETVSETLEIHSMPT